jgi:hypothetical protein
MHKRTKCRVGALYRRIWKSSDPMNRSRGADHEEVVATLRKELCTPHRGLSWWHDPRSHATQRGAQSEGRVV